ncbi:MAG TPA: PilN domain-containing protein [Oligoflexia bacterium]|nr:PilN domain-containing protein [Oligoflexia bacterium]HMP27419.1 PilN domain-containing protein [Oligoflexia bacterium]
MITINLLGVAPKKSTGLATFLVFYIGSLFMALSISSFLVVNIDSKIGRKQTKASKLEFDLTRLQKTTNEVRGLQNKQNELNQKLITIGKLKRNKLGPAKALDDLNKALPMRAWLTKVEEGDNRSFKITGRALDEQTIAGFMRDLQASDFFDGVDAEEIKRVEQGGIKVREFIIKSSISYTGTLDLSKELKDAADQKKPEKPQETAGGKKSGSDDE